MIADQIRTQVRTNAVETDIPPPIKDLAPQIVAAAVILMLVTFLSLILNHILFNY